MINKKFIFEQLYLSKLKAGDPDAFSDIYSAYYKDLVIFAYSIAKEMESSEEIVQETFMKLWEDHEKLDVKVSLKSLLLKSIQNRCIDWHRHKKIINDHCSYIINNELLYEYNTDNSVLWSELNSRIETAIANLPENIKNAYEMNRFDGLKYHEIAAKLNVSVKTVEVRISKALKLLRKELKDFL